MHTPQVITYQSPTGSTIDVCTACDGVADVPRNHRGEEHCTVSHGKHHGICGLADEPKRGVGRPPLGAKKRKKFSASMDPDVLARAKAAAGKGKLSAWLEAAAVARLAKEAG